MVYKCLNSLLSLAYPPRCRLCGSTDCDTCLCRPCRHDLPWLGYTCTRCQQPLSASGAATGVCGRCQQQPPAFDACTALFHYRPPVDFLVKRLKFSAELALGPLLAGLLAARIRQQNRTLPGLIVPVPLHRSRLRARGFNQAMELARCLGRMLDLPVNPRLCERPKRTSPQSLLSTPERKKNLRNAFRVTGPVATGHIAIVDDVMTSGHTASELARVLKTAGAEQVEVWVIAR
ncbi:MAG: ComF family protein, partial [Gammaproteobacteria bacterium]